MKVADKKCLVEYIIDKADQSRFDTVGGYPSSYVIEHGKVYWADYDGGKGYDAVTLGVWPIDEFITEHECWLEDDDLPVKIDDLYTRWVETQAKKH